MVLPRVHDTPACGFRTKIMKYKIINNVNFRTDITKQAGFSETRLYPNMTSDFRFISRAIIKKITQDGDSCVKK